jgi:hypothetical protein
LLVAAVATAAATDIKSTVASHSGKAAQHGRSQARRAASLGRLVSSDPARSKA